MKALLTGATDTASFDYTLVNMGRLSPKGAPAGEQTYHDTWRRLGEDTFGIAGKPLRVIRYRRTREGRTNHFSAQWDLLYDPTHRVFVKSIYLATYDRGSPQSWEVTSITPW